MLRWCLDTSAAGVVAASELRSVLEAAQDHFSKTTKLPGPVPVLMSSHKDYPKVLKQMIAGIAAACDVAEAHGYVRASISGQVATAGDEREICDRSAVYVDKADTPEAEESEESEEY